MSGVTGGICVREISFCFLLELSGLFRAILSKDYDGDTEFNSISSQIRGISEIAMGE